MFTVLLVGGGVGGGWVVEVEEVAGYLGVKVTCVVLHVAASVGGVRGGGLNVVG